MSDLPLSGGCLCGGVRFEVTKPPVAGCSVCGSHLFASTPGAIDPWGVRMGVLDGDPGIRPQFRQYVDYAAPWEPVPDDGLPRYPGRHA